MVLTGKLIRNKLWENNFIINDYLKQAKMKKEDKNIIESWNSFVKGKYLSMSDTSPNMSINAAPS